MSVKNTQEHRCPSFEDVSAFLDHELTSDSPLLQHISTCPECQRRLAEYRLIDEYVHRSMAVDVPEGMNERIKAAIARERRVVRFPANFGTFMRLAAAFTVCCGVSFYIMMDKTTPPVVPVGNNRETEVGMVRNVAVHRPVSNVRADDPSGYTPGRFNGLISAGSLVGASYGGADTPVFTDAMASVDRNHKPADIASQVQQVWAVKDSERTVSLLEHIMKQMKVPEKSVRITVNGDNVKLIAGLSKVELVNLVRACRACGLELLSPAAPQPEQNVFAGRADQPVVYYAEFVADK